MPRGAGARSRSRPAFARSTISTAPGPSLKQWDLAHPRPDVRRALQRRWVGRPRGGARRQTSSPRQPSSTRCGASRTSGRWPSTPCGSSSIVRASLPQSTRTLRSRPSRARGDRASAMGATTLVRLADQGMRALGVRAWRPSGAAGEAGDGRSDGPGVGGRSAGRQRRHEPGDRRQLVPGEEDRRAPRLERPPQARSAESHGARRTAAGGPRIRRTAGAPR